MCRGDGTTATTAAGVVIIRSKACVKAIAHVKLIDYKISRIYGLS